MSWELFLASILLTTAALAVATFTAWTFAHYLEGVLMRVVAELVRTQPRPAVTVQVQGAGGDPHDDGDDSTPRPEMRNPG